MFYIIYKITNTINGKIYIGCHQTSDLDDGYMGSGKILKRAQKKYGIENFEKEILEVFDKPETMFEMEAKLVNSDFVDRDDTYNLKEGGHGGFDFINQNGLSTKNKDYSEMYEQLRMSINKGFDEFWSNLSSDKEQFDTFLKNRIDIKIKKYGKDVFKTFLGRQHSDETKKKMSEAKKGKSNGESNSQFGTMWIHSLTEKVSKKINKDDFSDWEAKGWLKGRKMKF